MSQHDDLIARLCRAGLNYEMGTSLSEMVDEAAYALAALVAERESLSRLLSDALSALEYHQEQTRPIRNTKTVIAAIRAACRETAQKP